MAGKRSRTKGARGEREFFKLMNELLGYEAFKRNLMQSRQGGADDSEHPLVSVEVKRAEKLAVTQWLAQAKRQAEEVNKIPVLAFRQNKQPWRVLVELTPEQFADFLEDRRDGEMQVAAVLASVKEEATDGEQDAA